MATATLEKDATTLEQAVREPEAAQEARYAHEAAPGLYGKARDAAARYLELRGYEVLDRDWHCGAGAIDIVCWDGDTLVFADVQAGFDGFPDGDYLACRRPQMEAMALAYLGEYDYTDIPVRFDVLAIVPVGRGKAFLRHQINALGAM